MRGSAWVPVLSYFLIFDHSKDSEALPPDICKEAEVEKLVEAGEDGKLELEFRPGVMIVRSLDERQTTIIFHVTVSSKYLFEKQYHPLTWSYSINMHGLTTYCNFSNHHVSQILDG